MWEHSILQVYITYVKLRNSGDIGYILAFSLIMLNTDAHNPAVPIERKMKKEQFVYNLRGVNQGNDLDVNLLEKLYDNITKKPLEMEYERDEFVQW